MHPENHNKELTRQSILTHLDFFKNAGLNHVLRDNLHHADQTLMTSTAAPVVQTTTIQTEPNVSCASTTATLDLAAMTTLNELHAALANCQRCKLSKQRTNLVFGVGNPNADLMFVGEGPGEDEDLQGEPFVGKAGQLLTKIINAMGFAREDVYIANVVKCRPPENRNPELDEIETCMPFLKKQIELVQPKIIMCLGKFAAQTVLNTQMSITKMRGEFQTVNDILIMPAFHPAYLLRTPAMKRIMWEDCKKVVAKLEEMGIKPKK